MPQWHCRRAERAEGALQELAGVLIQAPDPAPLLEAIPGLQRALADEQRLNRKLAAARDAADAEAGSAAGAVLRCRELERQVAELRAEAARKVRAGELCSSVWRLLRPKASSAWPAKGGFTQLIVRMSSSSSCAGGRGGGAGQGRGRAGGGAAGGRGAARAARGAGGAAAHAAVRPAGTPSHATTKEATRCIGYYGS